MRKLISKLRYFMALLLVVTTVSHVSISPTATGIADNAGTPGISIQSIWLIEFI